MKKLFLSIIFCLLIINNTTLACSEFFLNQGGYPTSARTMDFVSDLKSKFVVNYRGTERTSYINNAKGKALTWTSKYGSITVNCLDFAVADGINEKGLSGAILWLGPTEYAKPGKKPALTYAKWIQYFLDNCEDVKQAIRLAKKIDVLAYPLEGFNEGKPAPLHLVLHDAKGKTAVFEYKEGKLRIYKPKRNPVLTNGPFYKEQLKNVDKYNDDEETFKAPLVMESVYRFARLSLVLDKAETVNDHQEAINRTFNVMNLVTMPRLNDENIKTAPPTLWRLVRDHSNLVYYINPSGVPFTKWINLKNIDFSGKIKYKQISVKDKSIGDITKLFSSK